MSVPSPDLVEAVQRAAAAVPGHRGDLAEVRRRGLARVRRRRAATAGVAAVVVGAGAVPLAYANGTSTSRLGPVPPASPVASQPVQAPPAQRLLLDGHGMTMIRGNSRPFGIESVSGIQEVLADGRLAVRSMSAVDGVYGVVPRPDGTMVVLGYVDHMPGVQRDDGPWIEGVSFDLVVLGPTGTVQLRRDVRVMGEHVNLAAATDEVVYLVRPGALVAHNLATGTEHRVLGLPGGTMLIRADVVGNRAAVIHPDECVVRVYDLATGAQVSRFTPRQLAMCKTPPIVKMSPDGRLAVMYFWTSSGPRDEVFRHRVAVFDTATGQLRAERVIEEIDFRIIGTIGTPTGVAWSDNHMLRMATAPLPKNPTRMYQVAELLRIETLRVGG